MPTEVAAVGYLVLTKPWSMLRGIWGDLIGYRDTYWSLRPEGTTSPGTARSTTRRQHLALGRVDDVMNVSGHRLSTAEIESRWSTTQGRRGGGRRATDETTGQASVASSSWGADAERPTSAARTRRRKEPTTSARRSARSLPRNVMIVLELPKTRSGKIMRRLLKDVAEGRDIGDDDTGRLSVMNLIRETLGVGPPSAGLPSAPGEFVGIGFGVQRCPRAVCRAPERVARDR